MLPPSTHVSISHFPLVLFEISKLIKYYDTKKGKAKPRDKVLLCFPAARAAPAKSPSACPTLPSAPLTPREASVYKLQVFSFPPRVLMRDVGMWPPGGRHAPHLRARGLASQRDEGLRSRRASFVSNKAHNS